MTSHIPSLNPSLTLIPKLEPVTESDPQAPISPPSIINFNLPVEASLAYPFLEPSLYTEFNNVAETFRSAFAQRLKRHEDVTVLDSLTGAIGLRKSRLRLLTQPTKLTRRTKPHERSELVRITDVGPEGERQFREYVRKKRMIYDGLFQAKFMSMKGCLGSWIPDSMLDDRMSG